MGDARKHSCNIWSFEEVIGDVGSFLSSERSRGLKSVPVSGDEREGNLEGRHTEIDLPSSFPAVKGK